MRKFKFVKMDEKTAQKIGFLKNFIFIHLSTANYTLERMDVSKNEIYFEFSKDHTFDSWLDNFEQELKTCFSEVEINWVVSSPNHGYIKMNVF